MKLPVSVDRLQEAIDTDFCCLRCGNCCKGDGLVHFGPAEADAMAASLGLTRRQFLKAHGLRIKSGRWILRDRLVPGNGPSAGPPEKWCVFLEQDKTGRYRCALNTVKPDQCRGFPALWRNSDSYASCAGLRVLMADLRRRTIPNDQELN